MRTLILVLVPLLSVAGGCAAGLDEEAPAGARALVVTTDVPVYINHTLGVFKPATIEAIQTNAYLNTTFIDVEVRTTERPDITYTGTYLNGRVTYFELFAEGMLGIPLNVFQSCST